MGKAPFGARQNAAAQRALDRCWYCPEPVAFASSMCLRHLLAHRVRSRHRSGAQPWRPGGRGRPPAETW